MEPIIEQFREVVRAASEARAPIRIRGGGTKDWYGQSLAGEILDTRGHAGVIAYEPTELVVTVRAGTPLAELEAVLAEQNQMLAFEPPHFGPGATVGGMVSAGLSGPRRAAVGAVRDFVLGATLMDGRGEVLRFGGQVMKNVAGYDVSRVLAGAMGTLGLLLDVSLKVLPRPFAEVTVHLPASEEEALRRMNEWAGQPLPVSATAWQGDSLLVRLSGAEAAVGAALGKIGGAALDPDEAAAIWADLREQRIGYFSDAAPDGVRLWRLSLSSVAPALALPGEQLIEWGGAQRWLKSDAPAEDIRRLATAAGGHATLFRAPPDERGDIPVFHPQAPALAAIQRRLQEAFDPAGIFNPGRLTPHSST